jgi:L-rhamnose mutarotase
MYIGRRNPNIPKENFLGELTDHIKEVRKVFGNHGLKGYVVYVTEEMEIAYQSWEYFPSEISNDMQEVMNKASLILENVTLVENLESKPSWLKTITQK